MSKNDARSKQIITTRVSALVNVMRMLLKRHSEGVKVLFGEVEWPTIEEWYAMLGGGGGNTLAERISGGEILPQQQRIIESVEKIERTVRQVGGPKFIVKRFKALRKRDPDIYPFLMDMAEVMSYGAFSVGRTSAVDMAERYHLSVSALMRRRDRVFQNIAGEILRMS